MSHGCWRITVFVAALGAAMVAAGAEAASPPKKFKDWSLYEHEDENGKTCFITSTATKQEGVKTPREAPRLFVTRFPVPPPNEQVMVDPGYRFKADGNVTLGVDAKIFTLLTRDNKAWGKTPEDDNALVAAMRRGSEAIVKGVSSIGTNPVDTYSLAGFSAAYEALGQACKNVGRR